jgi:hypothetical protein
MGAFFQYLVSERERKEALQHGVALFSAGCGQAGQITLINRLPFFKFSRLIYTNPGAKTSSETISSL